MSLSSYKLKTFHMITVYRNLHCSILYLELAFVTSNCTALAVSKFVFHWIAEGYVVQKMQNFLFHDLCILFGMTVTIYQLYNNFFIQQANFYPFVGVQVIEIIGFTWNVPEKRNISCQHEKINKQDPKRAKLGNLIMKKVSTSISL